MNTRDRLAAAMIGAAHNCYDHDDAPLSACKCEDPIFVSATTGDKATALDGSPTALADAVLAEVRLVLTTWRADVTQAIKAGCLTAGHLAHLPSRVAADTTCPGCNQVIRTIRGVELPEAGEPS